MELYSVLKPPTSSCSASTRSKGGRLSSAVAAIMKMAKGMMPNRMNSQLKMPPNWWSTMVRVDSEPASSTTAATDNPSAASYEIIWADARTEPSSGYFEPDDHPASITPYTATDDMASRKRMPTGGSANWSWVVWPATLMVPPRGTMAKAKKAGPVGPVAVLHVGDDLALEPHHEEHRHHEHGEGDERLHDDDEHHAQVEPAAEQRVALGQHAAGGQGGG